MVCFLDREAIPAPTSIQAPLTLQNGTSDCGRLGATPPAAPFSGEVDDVNGVKLSDLGLGCLYTSGLPTLSIPGGSTAVISVLGVSGTQLVLGASAGTGPTDCTRGAGPNRHCLNASTGTDGQGACSSDTDCGGMAGSCALDANCFFGPPLSAAGFQCIVNTLLSDICGTADLSGNVNLAATVAARAYLAACPQCVSGTCTNGANAGKACTATGPMGTSNDCPPSPSKFFATLTVPLAPLTTATSTLTEMHGEFCPPADPQPTPTQQPVCEQPPPPIAFGLIRAGSIREVGSGLVSTNLLNVSVGATFCIPKTGNPVLDSLIKAPVPGALSTTGQLDLTQAVLSGLLP